MLECHVRGGCTVADNQPDNLADRYVATCKTAVRLGYVRQQARQRRMGLTGSDIWPNQPGKC